MAPPDILSPELRQQYQALRDFLQRSLWLAEKCADMEASEILRTRLTNLHAVALLVIVGEVKAGKSSFINALVHDVVCEVAPGPCTAGIQELVYGEEGKVAKLGANWERIFLPKEVLQDISIVDTPGTNSIVENHQAITEEYIPQSDLVVFVFSATNPHTYSAWELLGLIRKEWHRKMVFVLQQADRATEYELTTNQDRVKEYAHERHVQNPAVFTVSAKREIEGASDSGFPEFRAFLKNAVECGEAWRRKVEGSYEAIRTVMTKLLAKLREDETSVAEERAFYEEVLGEVEARQRKANSLKVLLVNTLSATYDRLAGELEKEFADGLRLGRIFRRGLHLTPMKLTERWLESLKTQFRESAEKEKEIEAPRVSKGLSDEMQNMVDEVSNRLAQREGRNREKVLLSPTADRFEILEFLRPALKSLHLAEICGGQAAQVSALGSLALTGSVATVLGAAIAAAFSPLVWVAIAGVGMFLIGIVLVTVALVRKRSRLLRDFRDKLRDSKAEFRTRIESDVTQMLDLLFQQVRNALSEPLERLELQAQRLAPLIGETFQLGEAAAEIVWGPQQVSVTQPFN